VGLFASTLGPVCEELAFRGFMLPLLARSFGVPAGVLLTAIPFGLLHGAQYSWLWQQVVLVTLAGVVFGTVRAVTRSTAASAMMHATYNLTFFVGYLVQTRNTASW
jgi:membrane protease YdiL (CAAX protease family)